MKAFNLRLARCDVNKRQLISTPVSTSATFWMQLFRSYSFLILYLLRGLFVRIQGSKTTIPNEKEIRNQNDRIFKQKTQLRWAKVTHKGFWFRSKSSKNESFIYRENIFAQHELKFYIIGCTGKHKSSVIYSLNFGD